MVLPEGRGRAESPAGPLRGAGRLRQAHRGARGRLRRRRDQEHYQRGRKQ